ncbi:high affinity immunoglobulin gamma Fc receptor I-like isoform X1 [Odontesthes bonariensis]|uniref:high affinity immunoglobulin gamma Fc receptor I-like isoform X1 n=2 Tax=Odontesthes bonariensis TaxID=219752 RepID=UPI003F58E7AA
MEVTALCFRLLMAVMILQCEHAQRVDSASLHITPDKLQFFSYEQVTFRCESEFNDGVIKKLEGKLQSCKTPTRSTCSIKNLYPEDSGVYVCVAGRWDVSNIISINVTDGSVILESPAHPVMEGEAVTLSCRNKMKSFNFTTDFYKDGVHISSSSAGNVAIGRVSKSDEGLYKCNIPGVGESAESWLAVGGFTHLVSPPSWESTPWIVVAGLLMLLLVMVGLHHFGKYYWSRVSTYPGTDAHSLSEDDQTVSGEAAAADEGRPTYSAVMMNNRKNGEKNNQTEYESFTDGDQRTGAIYCSLSPGDTLQQAEPGISNVQAPSAAALSHLTENPFYSTIQLLRQR